jgi:hypothetical protein
MNVLITAPGGDSLARVVQRWADLIAVDLALPCQRVLNRMQGSDLLAGHHHMFYFGHGRPRSLVRRRGFFRKREEVLFDEDNLPEQGRVVVAVACWSGLELGPVLAEPPAKIGAFLGWLDDMSIPPRHDALVRDAIKEGLGLLLAGGSVGACAQRIRAELDRAHQALRASENHLAKMQVTYWRDRLVAVGDMSAVL